MTHSVAPVVLAAALAALAAASCKESPRTTAAADVPAAPPAARAAEDAGPPADRVGSRRVVTLYRWARTEPGNESTQGESIEHGAPKLHLVIEAHRDPQDRGWITIGALDGTVAIPESVRMRPVATPSGTWHVPRQGYTEYSLEQFGGELRAGEPIQVFLASAPGERQALPVGTSPTMVRLPASGTLPATPRAAAGQYDAIVVAVVPVTARRGGRYLVYALDMLPQPAGFAASGVMTHPPTAQEITRYAAWMRDRNGMGRDRNPPVAMQPIDR